MKGKVQGRTGTLMALFYKVESQEILSIVDGKRNGSFHS